jgi:anti-sigma factor RsiW
MDLHPDLEALIRYHDDELPAEGRSAMAAHVAECASCAAGLRRLRVMLGEKASFPATPVEPAPDRLAAMLRAIGEWRHGLAGEVLNRRVADRLGPFLGPAAADSVLQSVAPGGDNLLSTVEPVLALFLGGKAASRLIDQIVDTALVGD